MLFFLIRRRGVAYFLCNYNIQLVLWFSYVTNSICNLDDGIIKSNSVEEIPLLIDDFEMLLHFYYTELLIWNF